MGTSCLLVLLIAEIALGSSAQRLSDQAEKPTTGTLVSRGLEAMTKGDWSAAEEAFQQAVRLEPHTASLRARLGSAQLRQGKLREAEKSFAEAVRLQPRQPSFRKGLAEVYLRQSKLDEAARQLTTVVRLDPKNFDARYDLGLVFLRQKSCQQAITQLERANELASYRPEVMVNLVDAYFCARDDEGARRKAESARRQWPDSPRVLYSLGLILSKNGSYEPASEVLARAWELLPQETEIGLQWVRSKLALRSFREALGALLKIRDTISPTEETELLLAHSYVGLGDKDSAMEAFRRALGLNPDSAAAHLALGRYLFEDGNLEGSVNHLREAHRLAPGDTAVVTSLSQVLVKGGRFREVIELLEGTPTDPSRPIELLSLLGVANIGAGRFSSAISALEVITRRAPEHDRANFLLGYAHAELGQGKEALSAYETAIRLNPGVAVYYDHYASLLERQGKLAQAEESLRKSLALQPNSPVANYGLGRILAQAGKHEEAIGHLGKSIVTGQPPARAYYLLATCYARLGDTAKAKEYRDKFAEMAARDHRDEYIRLSGDVEALSFGRSQFALPPSAHTPPQEPER